MRIVCFLNIPDQYDLWMLSPDEHKCINIGNRRILHSFGGAYLAWLRLVATDAYIRVHHVAENTKSPISQTLGYQSLSQKSQRTETNHNVS